MRERPILFNGAMVRAILAGQKTQTRRAVKTDGAVDVVRFIGADNQATGEFGWCPHPSLIARHIRCPFGQAGDRLWVRETWRPETIHSCAMDTCDCDAVGVTYAADGEWIPHTWQNPPPDDWYMPEAAARGNVPSIHMPRWACRLVLEITTVRVERLHDISEADALAEGIHHEAMNGYALAGMHRSAGFAFRDLWTSTSGNWDSNPWVWAIEFKRVEVASG
jgi:hypothetical protein